MDNPAAPDSFEWFVGIFEGEGCIAVWGRGYTRLIVTMCDEDIVRRVLVATGMGHVKPRGKPQREHWSLPWNWQAGKAEEVLPLLSRMYPLLGERRRAKVREAFDAHNSYPNRKVYSLETHVLAASGSSGLDPGSDPG